MIRRSGGIKDIRHIASDILCTQRWFGCIFTAFGCSLPELLAQFVQLARSMRTVGIVVPNQEDVLPLTENEVGDVHLGLRSSVGHGVCPSAGCDGWECGKFSGSAKLSPGRCCLPFSAARSKVQHLWCQHQLFGIAVNSFLFTFPYSPSFLFYTQETETPFEYRAVKLVGGTSGSSFFSLRYAFSSLTPRKLLGVESLTVLLRLALDKRYVTHCGIFWVNSGFLVGTIEGDA